MSFFSNMSERYNLSFSSFVNCEPTYPTQIGCLLFAGVFMDAVFVPGLAKATSFVLRKLVPQRVRDQIFQETQDGWKNALDIMDESSFYTLTTKEFKKQGIDMDLKSEFEKLDDKGSFSKKVDAFFEEKKNVLMPYIMETTASGMVMGMQHGLSGAFGLWSLTMTSDKASFLKFARWGVHLEAGWELTDILRNIVFPAIKGIAIEPLYILGVLHHVCLYFCLPVNMTLLPNDNIGRDVVWAEILYAGLGAPITVLGFIKNFIDVSTFPGLFAFSACQLGTSVPFFFARGIHWPYFAYKLLTFDWGDSWVTYSIVVALVLFFSVFNVFMLTFIGKGLQKFSKKFKKSYAALKGEKVEDEEEELVPKKAAKRESSMVDVMVQDLSVSAGSGQGSSRRISIMGIDYELDDDEMKQANVRHSKIVTSGRSSVFAAFAALNEDDLDAIKEDKED